MGRRTADDCWSRFALYWGSSVQCTQEGGREGEEDREWWMH